MHTWLSSRKVPHIVKGKGIRGNVETHILNTARLITTGSKPIWSPTFRWNSQRPSWRTATNVAWSPTALSRPLRNPNTFPLQVLVVYHATRAVIPSFTYPPNSSVPSLYTIFCRVRYNALLYNDACEAFLCLSAPYGTTKPTMCCPSP
jgi:hypothetical protein